MKRITTKVGDNDLVSIMRQRRGQTTMRQQAVREPETPKRKTQKSGGMYEQFLMKYADLDKYIDSFKTRDLVYYFKKVAEDAGCKYVISNIQKDMHIFKVLMQSCYDTREICGMIEFLYNSEQDYLDKERLSPNILASRWVNTIYADFKLWVDDEYVPKSKKKYQKKEWTQPVDEENTETKIGEWE